MSDFIGQVCWDPRIVEQTISTSAISSSPAVFRATHAPMRIRRVNSRAAGSQPANASVTEEQLLHDFINARPNEGILVAPVLGQSGSGKSHLIRWVFTHIKEAPNRRVIYIQKRQTSLSDVVNALLAGREGGIFDQIRSQVTALGDTVDRSALKRRILDELAEALTSTTTSDPFVRPLVGANGLAVLMHDALFREYMLRNDGFIDRRADHAMNGQGDDDVPLEFTIDDLPIRITDLEDVYNVDDSGRIARDVYQRLVSNARVQQAAVNLMNENLDVAVMRAAQLGVGDINKAFLELRKELVGQEIILLIEDFVQIQGVRRDVLTAIIEPGVIEGVQKYATVRTLLAVTSGYYRQLDETFRTRVEASSPTYELDVPLAGENAVTTTESVDFVARYLNVARLGEDGLLAGGDNANQCDACEFREPCHDSFGRSRDGIGLYPYNAAAVGRAVTSAARDEHPELFSPREVLSRVVKDVLTSQVDEIKEGTFPGRSFSDKLPARPSMERLQIRDRRVLESSYDGDELTRRINFLEFWGGVQGLVNLGPGVHAAFGLSPLPHDLAVDAHEEQTRTEAAPRTEVQNPVPASLTKHLTAIEDWANGRDLEQNTARDVRNMVLDAVLHRAMWVNPPMRGDGGSLASVFGARTQAPRWIQIDGTRQAGGVSLVRFARSADNAQFFQDLVRAAQGRYDGTRASLARLESIAEKHSSSFEQFAIESQQFTEAHLLAVVRSLLAGSALCGLPVGSDAPKELIAATIWDGDGRERIDGDARLPQWARLEAAYKAQRGAVAKRVRDALGVSQGATGGVHALDVERILQLAKAALRSADDGDLPEWALGAHRALVQLKAIVPLQIAEWRQLCDDIRSHIPRGTNFGATLTSVIGAVTDGAQRGFVPQALEEVNRRNNQAGTMDFDQVVSLERLLEKVSSISGQQLWAAVGADVGADPKRIADYLQWTSRWVKSGLDRAVTQSGVAADDLDARIDAALRGLLEVTGGASDGQSG